MRPHWASRSYISATHFSYTYYTQLDSDWHLDDWLLWLMSTTDDWWGLLDRVKLLHSVIWMTSLGNSNCSVHCNSLYCNSFTLSGIESTAACFAQFCTIFSMFICCDWFTCSLDLLWLTLHGIRAIAGTRSLFYRCLYKKIWLNC